MIHIDTVDQNPQYGGFDIAHQYPAAQNGLFLRAPRPRDENHSVQARGEHGGIRDGNDRRAVEQNDVIRLLDGFDECTHGL